MIKIKNNNKDKFSIKNWRVYVLAGFCGILAVLSIFMTIESAASGAEVSDLQKQEALLLNQRQDLQQTLVESLSVGSLQEKSTELGFTKINNLVYVSEGIPVARLPQ
jgi:hypothetical protein